ncbi:MAG: hypothetical protein K2L96_08715 [Muribaculaceae bacterium]|nr:hypothetical protein [Muribaculaceae bacterium]
MKKLYFLLVALCFVLSAAATEMPRALRIKSGAQRVAASAPVTLPATDVTAEGFTANWKAVPGTETYSVLVYEPGTAATAGTYVILKETFDLVSMGTTIDPYFPDDAFVELSAYDWTYTPDWQGFWPVFSRGMVGGMIYSPYIDLVNDGGKFTVTMNVVGTAGGQVVLTSTGSDGSKEKATFNLTQSGTNTFTHTFTNGCHDTFLTFVDNGILNDPEGEYMNVYDFLDDITVTQELKAGDATLRLVGTAETGLTHQSFATLPYRYGATKLAYDVQANILIPGPDYPEDEYDYEVEHSPYSALEYVTLESGKDPDDPENPDDPTPVDPGLKDGKLYVGNFENPQDADIEAGTWWNRAPYQWYTKYSGSQFIYTADMLKGLKAGDKIKGVTFKYQDQGSFAALETELSLVIQNTEKTEFEKKQDTEKYEWIPVNFSDAILLDYAAELYYMTTEEIEFEFGEEHALVYDGQSIALTCWSENLGEEVSAVASVVKYGTLKSTMVFGSDTKTFQDVYETGFNEPYMTPEKFVPVAKFTVETSSGIKEISVGDGEMKAEYFNLQGQRVENPTTGCYIRRTGTDVEKVFIK